MVNAALPSSIMLHTGGSEAKIVGKFPPGIDGALYGYPDQKIGGLIVEGPFPYKNGPRVWSNTTRAGAYGLTFAPGQWLQDMNCPAIPSDHPLAKAGLKAVPFTNGEKFCQIGCNITEVTMSGQDPCKPGSINGPTNSPMSCFDVGPGFAGGWGLCGYNCTAFDVAKSKAQKRLVYCTDPSKCEITCDTRELPAVVADV